MTPLLKLVLEIGPLAVFFIAFGQFKTEDGDPTQIDALIAATAAFMVALAISNAISYALTRKISKMTIVTGVVVLVMGVLTIALRDDLFIKMKPTLVNGAFAAVLAIGLAQGQSYLKTVMGELLPMEDEGWMKLTFNWAMFFAVMAVLNEVVWRTMSTEDWVWVKTFVYLPITVLFTFSQTPLMARYAIEIEEGAGES